MTNLAKLFIHVVLDQPALDQCYQVAMVITYDEPYWTTAPSPCSLELGKPLPVLFVTCFKGYPRAAYIV